MEYDWEIDEEGYTGSDVYLDDHDPHIPEEEEQNIEDAIMEDDDGLNAQRQSLLEMLDSKRFSITQSLPYL